MYICIYLYVFVCLYRCICNLRGYLCVWYHVRTDIYENFRIMLLANNGNSSGNVNKYYMYVYVYVYLYRCIYNIKGYLCVWYHVRTDIYENFRIMLLANNGKFSGNVNMYYMYIFMYMYIYIDVFVIFKDIYVYG
jgi:uncharacterized protein YegP (UPF0339 family)